MGQKRQKTLAFLTKHPYCCFCGGNTPATTRDHLPPKSIFSGRHWPEGYEFPACQPCNNGSSNDDAIVGFVSRFNSNREPNEMELADWKKHARAFQERYPTEAKKLFLTANEKRRRFKEANIAAPEGVAYGQLPILRITPLMSQSIRRLSRKLILALHYKQTGLIAPSDAWYFTSLWTNFHRVTNEIPKEIFDLVPRNVNLRRGHVSLTNQFDYRFGISDDKKLGAYLTMFRKSLIVVGLLSFDPSLMRDINTDSIKSETIEVGDVT